MTDADIRLTCLKLAIDQTASGTSWTAILKVAGRFHHFITTGEDNRAGLLEGEI